MLQGQLGPAMATQIRDVIGQTSKGMQSLTGQLLDFRVQGSGFRWWPRHTMRHKQLFLL